MWYRTAEFYYDSRKTGRQQTDGEYADDLARLAGGQDIRGVVLDPSAASFREELLRRGWTVYRAENEVLSGIRRTAELLRAGEVIKPRLADCEQIKYLASRFVNTQSCFFIGRGFDYSLSLEGSLKLKEISYVHSDAYAAGELKHGTISLVTDGVPVIALATQKQVYEKTISNAKETKSRGAKVLLFTTQDAVVPDGVADYVVRLDDYDDLLMPLQLIVPLQLFAYYMAVLRGCDVDKPRNLAKSVTVE